MNSMGVFTNSLQLRLASYFISKNDNKLPSLIIYIDLLYIP
ncbi:Uncharacterised protein [Yersinia similis]|uniref:Uncharacterized protein n=1 Tax=Yersinia similis TaxID=367190 RepID=A0A0T9QUV4_9GAMM|nr:Uncharacterised protein [Yersinia similis]CNF56932.1 Uncharacterised protein [Yersinia similis]CNI29813.1 Uncharacterised protein [Yersinia similis]